MRKRLQSFRRSETHELVLLRGDTRLKVFAGVSRYEDGTPGELWVDTLKEGHELQSAHQAWTRLLSVALQHGMPIDAVQVPHATPSERCTVHAPNTPWHDRTAVSLYEVLLWILQ